MNLRSFAARLGGAGLLAVGLALAGCSGTIRSGGTTTVDVPVNYDMTIQVAKGDKYLLDGAELDAPTLEAHFRYLEDQKQLPKSVLLTDSDSTRVNNAALQEFANLQLSFHFTGYIMRKGKLTILSAVAGKQPEQNSEQKQDEGRRGHHRPGSEGASSGG